MPEQCSPKVPIYFPQHSFDWELMAQWDKAHRTQVFELTRDTAIWLDIDQEVDLYQSPGDLLTVYEVMVRARTPDGLIARAKVQHDLVNEFIRTEDSYLDGALIEKIRVNRNENGDLRKRALVIRDYAFSDLRNFYSRAFGGVFIFRSRGEPLIMCRDPKIARKYGLDVAGEHMHEKLLSRGYAQNDVNWWRSNLYRLQIIAESFLMDVLDKEEPELEFLSLNSAEQKAIIRKYGDQLGIHLELRRLIRQLENGETNVRVGHEASRFLIHSAADLTPVTREVVGQLLTYINGGRLVPLFYRHQKTEFAKAFATEWKTPKRQWALTRIREHYDLASKSSPTPS
jgi:hypothetical protein